MFAIKHTNFSHKISSIPEAFLVGGRATHLKKLFIGHHHGSQVDEKNMPGSFQPTLQTGLWCQPLRQYWLVWAIIPKLVWVKRELKPSISKLGMQGPMEDHRQHDAASCLPRLLARMARAWQHTRTFGKAEPSKSNIVKSRLSILDTGSLFSANSSISSATFTNLNFKALVHFSKAS